MTDPLFASARGRVLRVALPVPIDSCFDYEPPTDAAGDDGPWVGRRVVVPFSGRRLTGVVVETPARSECWAAQTPQVFRVSLLRERTLERTQLATAFYILANVDPDQVDDLLQTVIRYEEWDDLEALQKHFAAPHMATFRQALGKIEILSRDVKRYTVSDVQPL